MIDLMRTINYFYIILRPTLLVSS